MTENTNLWSFVRIARLRRICQEIDPFASLTKEQLEELEELGIPYGGDPFELTNRLILEVESALESGQCQ